MRRLSMLSTVLLVACLAVVPACKKKPADESGGGDPPPGPGPGPGPSPGMPPAAVSSDHLLYLHVNAKAIRDSAIFAEIKQALAKAGGTDLLDKVEGEASGELGFKPTDLDSVTACVTEVPPRGEPQFVVILTAGKAFSKTSAFGFKLATPDARGLYPAGQSFTFAPPGMKPPPAKTTSYVHFPDEKTAVLVSADLAQKYLDGYAKNRSAWPMSAEMTKAATGHTLFATVNFQKAPDEFRNARDLQEFAPLLAARTVTLTADLKGKEVSLTGRASFADAGAATKAKDGIQKFLGMAAGAVEQFTTGGGPGPNELMGLDAFKPVVKEAHRMVKEAKVDVAGSDVTLAASYKADFDIAKLVGDLVKQTQDSAPRLTAQNNHRQIGLALHNYGLANQDRIPVYGVGPKGAIITNAKANSFLSWRVAILPYIEQDNLYKQFKLDEPWDSEHNKKLIEQMPKIFAPHKPGKAGYTHTQMVVGPGAMPYPFVSMPATFKDGTSNTIAVVEAANPVIWTKPDDVVLTGKEQPNEVRKKFGGQFPGGFHVTMWDGTARFVPDTVSDRTLLLALNPNDGQILPADWDGGPARPKK